ncbi:MAG TPA: ATP-binding cassette domain-containing protein [Magnetospirillaceae bacterium]
MLAWVLKLWQAKQATTGDVVMISALAFTVLHATRDLAVALVDVIQHKARLSEAIATVLEPHLLHDHPQACPLKPQRGTISFEDVNFTYPGGRVVFENFTLHIEPGERIGLVGESGGGKSTLFTLLQRFQTIQSGHIFIDGQDIMQITQRTLHDAIAVVPQDISLFNRSVMENIRYARPDATDEEVIQAASAAECMEFISALPEGMETLVGDRGVKLSGGQRQRLAIARALLKQAPILLLDEATSALDGEAEEAIRTALERLMGGRTVIAIAHRLSSLRNFDRIVVLHGGHIIEEGEPDRLMDEEGPYRQMVERELSRLSPQGIPILPRSRPHATTAELRRASTAL